MFRRLCCSCSACGDPQAEQDADADDGTSVAVSAGSNPSDNTTSASSATCDSGVASDPENPCLLSTLEQLQAIADDLAGHYALAGDIDASATSSWNDGAGLTQLGTLTGSLDGNGFTVSGLYMNRPETAFMGMFIGTGEESEIRDIRLADVDITGEDITGALAAQIRGSVSGVHVSGSVRGGERTGGLAGSLMQTGMVSLSSVTGAISGEGPHTGGLIGENMGAIDQSWGTAMVQGTTEVGGLVGTNEGSVANSYTIVGSPDSPEETLEGRNGVGGVVGNTLEGATITGTYTVSFQQATRFDFVGFRTYGRGGGAEGVTSSYWADVRRPRPDSFARDPEEMLLAATYEGWDFGGIWTIDEGNSYPDLVSNSRF